MRKMLIARMQISAPAAAESRYRNFLSRASRKPHASIAAMQNMQRVMALNDPEVLNVKIEDLVDDRFVRKLDESGAIDRLYESYGVKLPAKGGGSAGLPIWRHRVLGSKFRQPCRPTGRSGGRAGTGFRFCSASARPAG